MTHTTQAPSLLLGLIGAGIGGSLSPIMYEQEAEHHGLKCIYQRVDLDVLKLSEKNLPELLQAAQQMGFAGLNITYPCKQAVIPFLNELSDEARAIGAVNTVVFHNGRRTGHNTDHYGFYQNLIQNLPDASLEHVVQLGAGGAGAAVAHAVLQAGAHALSLFDIDHARAHALAQSLAILFPDADITAGRRLDSAMQQASGLINATPIGMLKHPGLPLSAELLESRHWVADIVYFPIETELLRLARQKGCQSVNGLGMVVHQAVRAFELFSGQHADARRMLAHLTEVLHSKP